MTKVTKILKNIPLYVWILVFTIIPLLMILVFFAVSFVFSKEEVRHADDNIFSGFATSERDDVPAEAPEEAFDFCTETLAEIYAEQGYLDEAKQIYSKLSLRYPEKSVYFAALIEKLDKN